MTRYARRNDTNHADIAGALLAYRSERQGVALMLTDRAPWGDGYSYDVGQLAVMELRGAG